MAKLGKAAKATARNTPASNGQQQLTGRIVKALSGFYYVAPVGEGRLEVADAGTVQCRARGIFKKRGQTPLVGDLVRYSLTENGEGAVEEILPRVSELARPPVANAELAVLVFAAAEPDLSLLLLDKFLVHVEYAGIEAIICISKLDLANDGHDPQTQSLINEVHRIYKPLGYEIFDTSSEGHVGIEQLHQRLQGGICVFAGQSGVGKSSLLNALVPGLELETNEISMRLGRGKHTTRHVELIRVGESAYIADTPGFSQLDFDELGITELSSSFREFRELAGACRFRGCTHILEPGCAVLEALGEGRIAASRHAHYVLFFGEINDKKRRY